MNKDRHQERGCCGLHAISALCSLLLIDEGMRMFMFIYYKNSKVVRDDWVFSIPGVMVIGGTRSLY